MPPCAASWHTAWLPPPGSMPWLCHWTTEAVFPIWRFDIFYTVQYQTLWFLPQSECILPDKPITEAPFWKSPLPKLVLTWVPSQTPKSLWLSSVDGSVSAPGGYIHTDEPRYSKTSWKKWLKPTVSSFWFSVFSWHTSIRHLSWHCWSQHCQGSTDLHDSKSSGESWPHITLLFIVFDTVYHF